MYTMFSFYRMKIIFETIEICARSKIKLFAYNFIFISWCIYNEHCTTMNYKSYFFGNIWFLKRSVVLQQFSLHLNMLHISIFYLSKLRYSRSSIYVSSIYVWATQNMSVEMTCVQLVFSNYNSLIISSETIKSFVKPSHLIPNE